MPIYEYVCNDCNNQFEYMMLGMNKEDISCPSCSSTKVVKQFSTFSAHGGSSSSDFTPPAGGCSGMPGGGCPSGGCPMAQHG